MVGRMSLLTTRRIYLSRSVIGFPTLEWFVSNFRSFRFFELPTYADTGTGSVKKPCFLSDHIKPPCTEDRGRNRLNKVTLWPNKGEIMSLFE